MRVALNRSGEGESECWREDGKRKEVEEHKVAMKRRGHCGGGEDAKEKVFEMHQIQDESTEVSRFSYSVNPHPTHIDHSDLVRMNRSTKVTESKECK